MGLLTKMSKRAAQGVAVVVVATALACCGGGAAESSVSFERTGRSASPARNDSPSDKHPQRNAPPKEVANAVPAAGGCGSAVVRLGEWSGAIEFRLRCRPFRRHNTVALDFGLGRIADHAPARVQEFSRHPSISESGVVRRHGTCRRYGGGFGCDARLRAGALISGKLWVKKGTECDSVLEISEGRPLLPCRGDCMSDPRIRVVARLQPVGC